MTQMKRSGMPTESAAWWSSATARRARPNLVLCMKTTIASTIAAADAAAVRSKRLTITSPTKNEPRGNPMSSA
jgi:hypothetical protein